MSKIIEVTTESFQQEVIESSVPVLVDFYTDDCGPCEALKPVLEELVDGLAGKIRIVKFYVSIDEVLANSNEVAKKYDIMGFPTLLIIKNGEVVESLLGGQSRDSLLDALNKHV